MLSSISARLSRHAGVHRLASSSGRLAPSGLFQPLSSKILPRLLARQPAAAKATSGGQRMHTAAFGTFLQKPLGGIGSSGSRLCLLAGVALSTGLAIFVGTRPKANAASPASASGSKPLTPEVSFLKDTRLNFNGKPPFVLNWMQDGKHYVELVTLPSGEKQLRKVHAITGAFEPLYEIDKIQEVLARALGGGADATRLARSAVEKGNFTMSPDERACLIQQGNNMYCYHFFEACAVVVSQDCTPGEIKVPSFSPDGKWVAFVRDWDLKAVRVSVECLAESRGQQAEEFSLTSGGHQDNMNGVLDWVYQEEVYGRGDYKGYWWAPDSKGIVFMQLDESPIQSYSLVDHMHQHLVTEDSRYPKAGDANPKARLGLVSLPSPANAMDPSNEPVRWVELNTIAPPEDLLIVDVSFSGDGNDLMFQAQNKEQTWLKLCSVPLNQGGSSSSAHTLLPRTVLLETTPAWVNVLGKPRYLKNGSFVWLSEITGYSHIYVCSPQPRGKGQAKRLALTSGEWTVEHLYGVDEAQEWVYFAGTRDGWLDQSVYRVGLHGQGIQRLTEGEGTHAARFNPQCTTFLNTWSDANNPPRLALRGCTGNVLRSIYEGPGEEDAATPYRKGFSKPIFFQLPRISTEASAGPMRAAVSLATGEQRQANCSNADTLSAMMILPPKFDPEKRYPLLVYQYSGPYYAQVKNTWQRSARWVWHQFMAQLGYIVCYVDCHTSSGKGAVSVWPVHRNFGSSEMQDLKSAAQWLKRLPFVNANRVGLWGWSFGGYMTLYTLLHCDEFKVGISGAPVTDWKLYDTIYTERYMGTPATNPEGYKSSSVLEAVAAGKVPQARLLLLHGAMDDNVHLQNSIQLLDGLQRLNYTNMEFMVYPRDRHSCTKPDAASHLYKNMTDFITTNL